MHRSQLWRSPFMSLMKWPCPCGKDKSCHGNLIYRLWQHHNHPLNITKELKVALKIVIPEVSWLLPCPFSSKKSRKQVLTYQDIEHEYFLQNKRLTYIYFSPFVGWYPIGSPKKYSLLIILFFSMFILHS